MDMEANHGEDRLPHDVLLEILRRLPLWALVQSRRVCRAWRATIDDSTLLLTHFRRLFPRRAFPGVFTSNDESKEESSFFAPALSSRPSKARRDADIRTDGDEHGFRYPLFDHGWAAVKDHCNGLLLLCDEKDDHMYYCVCNPATVRCARLPSPPMSQPLHGGFWEGVFLAFDPAVSRHHEVFLFPQTLTQLRRGNEETYDMVQLPGIAWEEEERTGTDDLPTRSVLGSYEMGILYVALDRFQLHVWALNEPVDGQLGWTLTHETNLSPYVHSMNESSLPTQLMVPWKALKSKKGTLSLFEPLSDTEQSYLKFFEDRRYGLMGRKTRTKAKKDPKYSWDADEDNFIGMDESTIHLEPPWYGRCRIIGSHPHKETLLLRISGKALAYHLNTS
ncbi:hypothetical protein ACQ4PT_003871 [Festuca glaucescens]